jgi:type II secretory ATPase GspE/PulE/Tfp pilus assembly ATPase PilB-like protein
MPHLNDNLSDAQILLLANEHLYSSRNVFGTLNFARAIVNALAISPDTSLNVWISRLRNEINGVNLKGFFDHMLMESREMRASDIYLGCLDDFSSGVSYRINGDLHQMYLLPMNMMSAIFMSIKTESGMDASESRRPQEGRLTMTSRNKSLDVRVASQPMAGGETLSLRL